MVDFNEVRPHDALGGKTPAEVYQNSERRSLVPLDPTYPPEWEMRRVSRSGTISVDDDAVPVSTALAGQIIGIRKEGLLRWRARFFEHDLGTIEIAPLGSALVTGAVSGGVNSPRKPQATPSSHPVTGFDEQPESLGRQAVSA